MVLYTELPVFKDTYQLVLLVYQCTRDFPREYKYTLGQDMKRDILTLLRGIYRANKYRNREGFLDDFLDNFELLKLEIRLCVDMKLISLKMQAQLISLMSSIGKQVTGWRNASRKCENH